jgi:hypothetical protein
MKQHSSSEADHKELLRQLDEADLKAAYHTGHPGPHSLNGRAANAIRALLSATAPNARAVADDAVVRAAIVISQSPLIDEPKLPPVCWEGLARSVLEAAALPEAPQPATQRSEPCQRLGCRFEVAQSMLDRAKERGELSEQERASLRSETPPSGTAKVPEGWIPVGTSDVPPEGHHVLVYTFWDKCIWTAYTQNGKWHHANGDGSNKYVLQRVVAWMELPPSPDGN